MHTKVSLISGVSVEIELIQSLYSQRVFRLVANDVEQYKLIVSFFFSHYK